MTVTPRTARTILISGAGIAGPALAYWLRRYGFTPTVVERAPSIRDGGYAVDFRGPVHLATLERMALLDVVEGLRTGTGDLWYVDARGRRLFRMPAEQTGGDIEVLRGDLARVLFERTRDGTEYLFGDSIASITDDADGAHVTFERSAPRTFDLVIGADGLHSRVRALTFGPEQGYLKHLGLYCAIFTTPNILDLDHTGLIYGELNRLAVVHSARGNTEAKVMLYFASPPLTYDRDNLDEQRAVVDRAFAGGGWQTPRLLELLATAPDLYLDSVSQVRMDTWTRGRVALLGDAGYGASPLSGMGSGLAMVAAHVLAGELAMAQGDHRIAFERYESTLRAYVHGCQKLADGIAPFMVPNSRTAARLVRLNQRMLRFLPFLADMPAKMARRTASALTLPAYPD
ncbi:FAD-dependent oxidoreductase [Actinoplanes lobatus]|uniref:FAD-dependent oxidoreductase n=1 Tax=Actinoplanes lobatus TaxID=113568 RepID=A0A7W7MJS0_9ACTN|nr:FAD-dependent monooxygenase [Actinoplanes lobatus]MBB4752748.1 2-polyprenyl-6-methoxyphenol hydroxylase-like FAD-dependent oxidoreductase [Actinoplanes lobatus]GGN90826.1 FAD-dependent oxidoreductase [Actinoplanes lobatus]GIE43915.1 FAD-dependent oxidoreductase [Actinoplanes lobatus]